MNPFRRVWGRVYARASWVWQAVAPGTAAWRGAAAGIVLVAVLWSLATAYLLVSQFGWWTFPAFGGGLVLASGVAAILGLLLVRWLVRWPGVFLVAAIMGGVLLTAAFSYVDEAATAVIVTFLLVTAALTGAAVSVAWRGQWRRKTAVHRWIAALGLLIGPAGLVGSLIWFLLPGPVAEMPPNAALQARPVANKSMRGASNPLADPSQPGPYDVLTLTYGSGTDRHRPAFGDAVDLETQPVNGDRFLSGWTDMRTRYWGFDETELPRNGRVWYPDGDGPFPLVLIVHGNHSMEEYSDPGYAYLGELLASRGIIVVSVDQNFLNGSVVADWFGRENLNEENDARGWLLLEHLRLWRGWAQVEGTLFHGKVDMEHIALIGHSRGGEAAAVAAMFNHLPRYPDNARAVFNYDFDIRAIVAIAPTYGQYRPADAAVALRDVNYLVIQGSHDMDLTSFQGQQQFERVTFTGGEWFKSAVYVYAANHGQFNSVWGRTDRRRPTINFYNLGQLLPESDQRRIGEVFIAAFLEATLHGQQEYAALFRDYRPFVDWLPDTVYLTRYEDAAMEFILTFDEDVDVTTTTMPGGSLAGRYLTTWREEDVDQRGKDVETGVVVLGWEERQDGNAAVYTISLPPDLTLDAGMELVFSLADGDAAGAADEESRPPINLSLQLRDSAGATAVLPLSHFSYLQPQIAAYLWKIDAMGSDDYSEVVLQSFAYPLADFAVVNPELDLERITDLSFIFDRTPEGKVVLDNLGFR